MVSNSSMKSWKWIWVGCLITGWFFGPGLSKPLAGKADSMEKDITQKRKDLKDIKKEISVTREKEKEIRGQETSVLESLSRIEAELYRKEKELKQMEARLTQTQEKLQQTKHQIHQLSEGMEQTKEIFFSRLIALYKMGQIPPETFLFTSRSYPDLLKTDKYMRVIIDFDAQLVDTYRTQVSLKERYQSNLMEDQSQWERSIGEVEKKREEIKKGRDTKRRLLKSIQNQKAVYQKVITELEERAKGLQALIDKLERERKAVAYARAKPDVSKGKLMPPVHGSVISLFMERGQNGIEIKAPMGTEVRSILPGKVLYADWFKGFGNVMIVDHGDQTFTVSGYCSQLLKKVGEVVSQGETIALVGSAGSLKGPCLYFEIRHKGKPQDPMDWISHLDKVVTLPEANGKGRKGL